MTTQRCSIASRLPIRSLARHLASMKTRQLVLRMAVSCVAAFLVFAYIVGGEVSVWHREQKLFFPETTDFQTCVRTALRSIDIPVDSKLSDADVIGLVLPSRHLIARLMPFIGPVRILYLPRYPLDHVSAFIYLFSS